VASRRVLIVVENLSVPFDRRVWQESLALRRAGHEVVVICPMGSNQDTEASSVLDGVEIHRYPLRAAAGGPAGYLKEYASALWHSLRLAARIGRIDAVHLCNPPDLLFLIALPLKLRGARVVFDQHDLVPELYLSRFGARKGLLYSAMLLAERITYRVADVVIATNESYRDVALRRGRKPRDRVFVVRSAPDLGRFQRVDPEPALKRGKNHLIHFHGVMGPQDGVDKALEALAVLRTLRPEIDWHAVFAGAGDMYDQMVQLRGRLGLDERVDFPGRISDEELLRQLSTATVGLAPDPPNPLNDVSTMNKVLEYMAVGLPIVSFDLHESRASAGDAAVYAKGEDVHDFAARISALLDDPEECARRGEIGRRRLVSTLSWDRSSASLLSAYRALFGLDEVAPRPNRGAVEGPENLVPSGGRDQHADET
jgi:glycosyltransferase involved in cell wall biosynthesis